MRCGHPIHSKCLHDYLKTNIICPICRKSIVDPKLFEAQMDAEIAAMQMPDDYKDTIIKILCNDCNTKNTAPFHILGAKCKSCNSYNTSRIESWVQN